MFIKTTNMFTDNNIYRIDEYLNQEIWMIYA